MNDDKIYINAILIGDASGFDALYQCYYEILLRYAKRIAIDNALAEDAIQASFVKLWTKPPLFLTNNSILPWLYKVTLHYILDYHKKHRKFSDLYDAKNMITDDIKHDHVIDKIFIEQQLKKLPLRQRIAITLFYFDGFSQKEAAKIMKINQRAFESLLARGKKLMRDHANV